MDVEPAHEDPAAPAPRCVSRAVDALHRLRHAAGSVRLPVSPRRAIRAGVRTGDGRSVLDVQPAARRRVGMGRGAVPAQRGRIRGRAHACGARKGARPRPRPAARRVALAHGHVRKRSDVRAARAASARASACGGARVRDDAARGAAEDHPELRDARAARGSRRSLDRVSPRAARRGGHARRAARAR